MQEADTESFLPHLFQNEFDHGYHTASGHSFPRGFRSIRGEHYHRSFSCSHADTPLFSKQAIFLVLFVVTLICNLMILNLALAKFEVTPNLKDPYPHLKTAILQSCVGSSLQPY